MLKDKQICLIGMKLWDERQLPISRGEMQKKIARNSGTLANFVQENEAKANVIPKQITKIQN